MSANIEWTLALGVLATLGAAGSLIGELIGKLIRKKEEKKKPELTKRVETLTASLTKSTSLISEIQDEIEKRHELVTKLKEDTEHYNTLSKLKEKEAEAVAQLLEGIVNKDSQRSFYKGVIVNFIFFALGVAASYAITQFI